MKEKMIDRLLGAQRIVTKVLALLLPQDATGRTRVFALACGREAQLSGVPLDDALAMVRLSYETSAQTAHEKELVS